MKKVLWWLFASRGGVNRAKIINKLHTRPYNAHQLADELKLDYTTIRHHLKVLEENNVVTSTGEKYNIMYFLSDKMEENYNVFEEIWESLRNK